MYRKRPEKRPEGICKKAKHIILRVCRTFQAIVYNVVRFTDRLAGREKRAHALPETSGRQYANRQLPYRISAEDQVT